MTGDSIALASAISRHLGGKRGFVVSCGLSEERAGAVSALLGDGLVLEQNNDADKQIENLMDAQGLIVEGGFLADKLFNACFGKLGANACFICLNADKQMRDRAKDIIDNMHAWHSESDGLQEGELTRTVLSVSCYDGVVAIQRAEIVRPYKVNSGRHSVWRDLLNVFALFWRLPSVRNFTSLFGLKS